MFPARRRPCSDAAPKGLLTPAPCRCGAGAQFGAVGDKFDPHQHEALFEFVDVNKEAGTVGQVRGEERRKGV